MASRIEQIIEEIEEYVDSCRFDRCEQGGTRGASEGAETEDSG